MSLRNNSQYLQGIPAIEIIKHVYPGTMAQIVMDLQSQINGCRNYKESQCLLKQKLSEKEIFEIDNEISEKTVYVKGLLELYAAYNYPSVEMQDLCTYYGIKTFDDKFEENRKKNLPL